MGLDALLDVAQSLGARGSSASAGGTGLYMARATCTAQAASPISRWLRRNREWAIRSCSSGRPEACERGRPSAPDRGLHCAAPRAALHSGRLLATPLFPLSFLPNPGSPAHRVRAHARPHTPSLPGAQPLWRPPSTPFCPPDASIASIASICDTSPLRAVESHRIRDISRMAVWREVLVPTHGAEEWLAVRGPRWRARASVLRACRCGPRVQHHACCRGVV